MAKPISVLLRQRASSRVTDRRRVLVAQSWWQDRVLEGIAHYAAGHNWILDFEMRWSHRIPLPGEWQGDGIIAYVGIAKPLQPLIQFIRAQKAPVVLTHLTEELSAPSVIIPHEEVGRVAAKHLLGLNFQHLAFVEFADNALERGRREGFQAEVESRGRIFHPLRFKELGQQLRHLPRPMALFAINDLNALAVIRACLDGGFSVPEDFAIIGADNTEILCKFSPVPLSSVNCNFEKQGYEAAALLDRLMRKKTPPEEPILISPSGVTVRRSTDTVALSDPDAARVLRFLRDHYREPIKLCQVAGILTHSFRRVQMAFRKSTGRTLFQELMRLRLEHAKMLMRDSKMKISTLAVESGFSNRYHFTRAFRRATGLSPKSFRVRLRRVRVA
jgi:LacI family transcriptional regulator